jgi:hypothetical protein
MGFLIKVCEESCREEAKPEIFGRFGELKEVLRICLDEDIRLASEKCVPLVTKNFPTQSVEAKIFAETHEVHIVYAGAKPKETIDQTCDLIKAEETKHGLGWLWGR